MSDRTLLIRVDANSIIASGHLMRCISIAKEAVKHNIEIVFLMSDSYHKDYVENLGFKHINLNTDWRNLDKEVPFVKNLIKNYRYPILLIDTYSINKSYTSALYGLLPLIYLGSKTSNLGKLDGIINYSSNIDYDFYNHNYPYSKLMLGVKYAPLREEFQSVKTQESKEVKEIFISTGNTDNHHFISQFLKTSGNLLNQINVKIHVIVGSMFDNIEELNSISYNIPKLELHYNVRNIAEIMRECQLAISANGTTIYELAACNVPTISFSISREQEKSGKSLGAMGVVDYCGFFNDNIDKCLSEIRDKLILYVTSELKRHSLRRNAKLAIDGKGCQYIMDNIKDL